MFFKCFFLLSAVNVLSAGRVPQPENRIIGGYDTEIEIIPWQVSILQNGIFICGGAIYNAYFIITAAHCLSDANIDQLSVRAGSAWTNQGGTLVTVGATTYNGINKTNYDNDFVVLRLDEPLQFSEKIQPIPLAEEEPTIGSVAIISGWGISKVVTYPKKLQSSYVYIRAPHECKRNLIQSKICAGGVYESVCDGDSGGPLVVNGKLVGVTSIGIFLCNKPGIFTSIPYFRNIILESIRNLYYK
ncbi:hypothetical protein KR009_000508 [Drosophila setifemur]|nr:hypothetical protein KR009_000508 [Drosophila setifemur]